MTTPHRIGGQPVAQPDAATADLSSTEARRIALRAQGLLGARITGGPFGGSAASRRGATGHDQRFGPQR